jgi:transcriptional regulator with XRE-family HTH domain
MTFAESLKSERARLGLTQAAAAALLEISPRVLWEWEAGKTEPYPITREGALARLKKAKPKPAI